MRKTIKNKILISILAMSSVNLFASAEVFAVDVTVDDNKVTSHNNQSISDFNGYNFINDNSSNNNITVSNSTLKNFYGISLPGRYFLDPPYNLTNNNITINGSIINGNIIGNIAASSSPSATNLTLTLKDTTVDSEDVDGGEVVGADLSSYSYAITVNNIKIVLEGNTNINNADVILFRRSTWAIYSVDMSNCEIILRDNADVSTSNLFAFTSTNDLPPGNHHLPYEPITPQNTTLTLDGWSGTVNSLHDFDIINFNNIDLSKDNITLDVTDAVENMSNVAININSIAMAGDYKKGVNNHFVSWDEDIKGTVTIAGEITNNLDTNNYYTADRNGNDGIYATKFNSLTVSDKDKSDNQIEISADIKNSVLTGKFIDENGAHYNSNQNANDHTLTIDNNFKTNAATIAGAYAAGTQNATDGEVNITGGTTDWEGIVYAGYSESGSANGNIIYVAAGTNASQMTLSGTNDTGSDNVLNLAGSATFKAINNFDAINFDKIDWINGGTVLNITDNAEDGALANTNINLNSLNFVGGTELNAGESMYIINGKDLGIGTGTGKVDALSNFTAGVAIEGTGMAEVASDGNSVKYTLTKVKHTDQIDLVAQTRAASAAFVNQGTDLIADSLDTISRDSNYGVKTFAAVHGNRSKYDVNSDIKINGWSTIVGVGNAGKFDNGSEFSWGVFYENGSGNYRTYNEFNNEFFRGDGSLVYNGGGIAARYTNKNGVYTEGSLRAGMLKSDMDNALRDGAGNFYGYESESAYYGAHIGVGKIISLSESSDLDVYGKFFHTYTEGDSFKVANDEFEFDSINSDRLRIGARITSNKENKFSTYYGLAYEYEFNGDADMTAQGLKAPTHSLQGSSVMAEVGFNYQPTPTSPWSFDLNMRGYTGERQGGSFNVQATYTF